MKVSDRLFQYVKPQWDAYLEKPFIKGMENGSLDKEKFKFYLIQDYLYLLDYAKVFALGVVKSKQEKHMQIFGDYIQMIINGETDTHKEYIKKLGITQESIETSKTSLTTESYTKYMLAVAFEDGLAEIAVAVLACSWSYHYIARKINPLCDHGFYKEWVEAYASEAYAIGNDLNIDLVDELTQGYSEEQIKKLEKIIDNCSRYEGLFWDMAWNMEL